MSEETKKGAKSAGKASPKVTRFKETVAPSVNLEIKLKQQNNINLEGVDTRLIAYLNTLESEYQEALFLTSAKDGQHAPTSRHYTGDALDLRIDKNNPWEDKLFKRMMRDPIRLQYGITLLDPSHGTAPHIHMSLGNSSENKKDVWIDPHSSDAQIILDANNLPRIDAHAYEDVKIVYQDKDKVRFAQSEHTPDEIVEGIKENDVENNPEKSNSTGNDSYTITDTEADVPEEANEYTSDFTEDYKKNAIKSNEKLIEKQSREDPYKIMEAMALSIRLYQKAEKEKNEATEKAKNESQSLARLTEKESQRQMLLNMIQSVGTPYVERKPPSPS